MVIESTAIHLLLGPIITLVYPLLLIWPYAKVTITFWLLSPYFAGAAYVYDHLVKPCFSLDQNKFIVWFISWNKDFIPSRSDDFLAEAERYIQENGAEALLEVISKDEAKKPFLSRKDMVCAWPHSQNDIQREWTCVLCTVTTTSENNLRSHLQGKKHKANEELIADRTLSMLKGGSNLMMQRTNMVDLVQDFKIKEFFLGSLKHHINPFARPLRWCTWEKPKVGWTKLNTDGSIDLKNARLGGLLRDHLGCPTRAFVSKVPRDGIFSLELWAVWRGLKLALGQGVKTIWVESDSKSVVQVINKNGSYPQKNERCLKQIWKLLKRFEKFRVTHSWREANRAADHLAKMNLYGRDVELWPADFPEPLCNIIKEDAEGKKYCRL
ncbi:hypothetical protein IFM89_005290 [Coptis chinensis]|uniref:U1-type domain-containing protein n=1 Tax=Coptis chinensis TaxID=261450 RepID=A0A835M8P8_9MAGN|nr:hypothetical protein IFM89_005290 [Coptis chinensis]